MRGRELLRVGSSTSKKALCWLWSSKVSLPVFGAADESRGLLDLGNAVEKQFFLRSSAHLLSLPCTSARFSTVIISCNVYGGAPRRLFVAGAEESDTLTCWSCEKDYPCGAHLVCPHCKSMQPIDPSMDFFQIFEIERTFEVDPKVMEQRYKGLQKILHPDLASSKTEREQSYAGEQSAHVIQAYYTLLRPLSRARYLLGLNDVKVDEEGTITDHGLLTEIMELRELIEDANEAEQLQQLKDSNKKRVEGCEVALGKAFKDKDVQAAVVWTQRLSYYIKLEEEITRKL